MLINSLSVHDIHSLYSTNPEPHPSMINHHNYSVDVENQNTTMFNMSGFIFIKDGKQRELSDYSITTSFVYSWSPMVEQSAAQKFLDPSRQNSYYAVSPSLVMVNKSILFLCRIWLNQESKKSLHKYVDNSLYMQYFNMSMQPISRGFLIGLQTPQWTSGGGPRGPRLFMVNGNPFIIFGTTIIENRTRAIDTMFLWDHSKQKLIIPNIEGGAPMSHAPKRFENQFIKYYDKNWMPLDINGSMHIVYTMDPLMVMRCDNLQANCSFVHTQINVTAFPWLAKFSYLRGGTPFMLFRYPYYVSFAHSTLFGAKPPHQGRYYNVHLVVLRVYPFSMVYISDKLQFNEDIFRQRPKQRGFAKTNFIFPQGLMVESTDSFLLSGHANDHSSVLVRVQGMGRLMQRIMEASINGESVGPSLGELHILVKQRMQNSTGIEFM